MSARVTNRREGSSKKYSLGLDAGGFLPFKKEMSCRE